MKSATLIICLVLLSQYINAQFIENFNDGDFNFSPVWLGDTSYFEINSGFQLQSAGSSQSDIIHLSTGFNRIKNTIWEFETLIDFNPSTSNHSRFYLVSDKYDLEGNPKGYFIKLGGESGSLDRISLVRDDSSSQSSIIQGIPGFCGRDSNSIKVRVERDYFGEWKVYADSGSNQMIFQGSGFDSTYQNGQSIGIYCKHTASRSASFYFDNFIISNGTFKLVDVKVSDTGLINLVFSSPLDTIVPSDIAKISINSGQYEIDSITWNQMVPNQIRLWPDSALESGDYTFIVSDLFDDQGQYLSTDTLTLHYLSPPEFRDIVINEIMVDPLPQVGMPESEFVELFNASQKDFNMGKLAFGDSKEHIALSNQIIKGGGYMMLCRNEDTSIFKYAGPYIALDPWPSLNNTGDLLTLRTSSGKIIDEVNYDESWLDEEIKGDGGWTLERINPFRVCSNKENWAFSIISAGGTPGKINSVFDDSPDIDPPLIDGIRAINSMILEIEFSESIDTAHIKETSFNIHPYNKIQSSIWESDKTVQLIFGWEMDEGLIYSVTIDSIFDCEGNLSSEMLDSFGIGRSPDRFEILFTEIMADPIPWVGLPETEFLELVNSSDEILNLENLLLVCGTDSIEMDEKHIWPGEYFILCSKSKVDQFEFSPISIGLSPWPGLNNSGEKLSLLNQNELIHQVNYDDSWYHDLTKKEGGWSLELIDLKNPCEGIGNWEESSNPLGGTPGNRNSTHASNPDLSRPAVLDIIGINDKRITIKLNEEIEVDKVSSEQFTISPGIGVDSITFDHQISSEFSLNLKDELQAGQEYLCYMDEIRDCVGNLMESQGELLIIPEHAKTNTVIINEVLYEPNTGASEFIELFNRSNKYISLFKTIFKIYDLNNNLKDSIQIGQRMILPPFGFKLISSDTSEIKSFYPRAIAHTFFELTSLTPLINEGAIIVLSDSNNFMVDSIIYTPDFHYELLDEIRGVSLERISPLESGLNPDNWTSASEMIGYASPGFKNSQFYVPGTSRDYISVDPLVFSPDYDGYEDITFITVNEEAPGFTANIDVFDYQGNHVVNIGTLVNLGFRNQFIWDGIDKEGKISRSGVYVIYIEIFNVNGARRTLKKLVSIYRS